MYSLLVNMSFYAEFLASFFLVLLGYLFLRKDSDYIGNKVLAICLLSSASGLFLYGSGIFFVSSGSLVLTNNFHIEYTTLAKIIYTISLGFDLISGWLLFLTSQILAKGIGQIKNLPLTLSSFLILLVGIILYVVIGGTIVETYTINGEVYYIGDSTEFGILIIFTILYGFILLAVLVMYPVLTSTTGITRYRMNYFIFGVIVLVITNIGFTLLSYIDEIPEQSLLFSALSSFGIVFGALIILKGFLKTELLK